MEMGQNVAQWLSGRRGPAAPGKRFTEKLRPVAVSKKCSNVELFENRYKFEVINIYKYI